MKFRKIIGIAALTLLLSVTAASADGEPGIKVEDGKICASLSGQVDVQSFFGFDDLQISALPQIDLTTITPPKKELGKAAVDLVLWRRRNPNAERKSIEISSRMIIRKTT